MRISEVLEDAIVGKIVRDLLDEGYEVRFHVSGPYVQADVYDGNDHFGWVRLVPGNGADVISDFSTNLIGVLEKVNTFVQLFEE